MEMKLFNWHNICEDGILGLFSIPGTISKGGNTVEYLVIFSNTPGNTWVPSNNINFQQIF